MGGQMGGRGAGGMEEKADMDAAKGLLAEYCYDTLVGCGIDIEAFMSRFIPGATDNFQAYVQLREAATQCTSEAVLSGEPLALGGPLLSLAIQSSQHYLLSLSSFLLLVA
jgi:hypothetical protein